MNKPYPRPESRSVQIATVVGVGVFIAIFLLIFKPFGLHDDYPNRMMIIVGYGAITAMILAVTSLLLPMAFPTWYQENRWTVGKELLMSSATVFTIGLANAIYTAEVFRWPLTAPLIINFQIITVIVGVIPMAFLVLLRQRQQAMVYDSGARGLNSRITEYPNSRIGEYPISSEGGRDVNLVAIEAADNYITEYWLTPKGIRQNLVRATMASIELRTDLPPSMMRCHRSWFVSLDHVDHVSGNAQGYRLHVGDNLVIPVARTRSAELERRLPHHSPLRPK